MEKNKTKSTLKNQKKTLIFGFVSALIVIAAYIKGQDAIDYSSQTIYDRLLSKIRLEKIIWNQTSESNLSGYVQEKMLLESSKLKLNEPLVDLDLESIENNIRKVPWISSVQISTRLPNAVLIEYELHSARAMVIQNTKPWFVSSVGKIIAQVRSGFKGDHKIFDLPVISGFEQLKEGIEWLDVLETGFLNSHIQIHEIINEFSQVSVFVDLIYENQIYKVRLMIPDTGKNNPGKMYSRLNQVVHYLIKNNILVSSIDLRAGQKVVVIVGKNL